jgi:hypothetical protein
VKTIQDRTIRVRAFVFVAMLILLLSSMIGTVVWAKPGRPPPPPPELYKFTIMIGTEGEDMVLVDPEFLEVEASVSSCGWHYPYAKGTRGGGWYAYLNSLFEPPAGEFGECGIYNVMNLELPSEISDIIDAQGFWISHTWERGRKDYWELSIFWGAEWNEAGQYLDPDDSWVLTVRTNLDSNLEGTYDSVNEVWEVNFNGAIWELIDFEESTSEPGVGYGHLDTSGTIIHGLTVTIDKIT